MTNAPPDLVEARLYETQRGGRVRCHLCAYRCVIQPGKRGVCRVRFNGDGKLYTAVYGRLISEHADPVEKKPLFHFRPGSRAYSVATAGCNLRCGWCQNWEISQLPRERRAVAGWACTPAEIVAAAERSNCSSVAYTYTEPTVFFEYAHDTARLAREAGLANILVTNGYMTREMLEAFAPLLDAVNVDLKAFRDSTYRKYVRARLQPVLDTMKTIKSMDVWLEVTTLVIPGVNDAPEELRDLVTFIVEELGDETPWHVSRFFPAYRMAGSSPTPVATLCRARDIAKSVGLRYVYTGNLPGDHGQDTHCPACGRTVIRRAGYTVFANLVTRGACPDCWTPVAGVGMSGDARLTGSRAAG